MMFDILHFRAWGLGDVSRFGSVHLQGVTIEILMVNIATEKGSHLGDGARSSWLRRFAIFRLARSQKAYARHHQSDPDRRMVLL